MIIGPLGHRFKKLSRSNRALAIPVTFLILFVSMLGIISITYYYAVERVNGGSQFLKVSMAKQNMNLLDEDVLSILWQPGSARTLEFSDCGGTLIVHPSSNRLLINITDNSNIADTILNTTIGQVKYELPYSESADTGLFLRGDSRVIVNQSGLVITQLYIRNGAEHPEILLCYRPMTSSTTTGTENGKTVNDLRIYVVNLNSSQDFELMGEIPLRISCTDIVSTVITYNVSYSPSALMVIASLGDNQGQVSIPISGTAYGAVINVDLVVCEVRIERWVR